MRLVTSGHAVEDATAVTLCEIGSLEGGVALNPNADCGVLETAIPAEADVAVLDYDGTAFDAFETFVHLPTTHYDLNHQTSGADELAIPGFSELVDTGDQHLPHLVRGRTVTGSATTSIRREHALRASTAPEGFSGAPVFLEQEDSSLLVGVVAATLEPLEDGVDAAPPWLSMVTIAVVAQCLAAA